jgi:mono/diheme cytochrome c family protein
MGCSRRFFLKTRRSATAFVALALMVAIWAPTGLLAAPVEPPARISFNRDIRPILSDNCFACHGPDSGNRQAGLRLDMAEQATSELDSGSRAIVPENFAASELIARIISTDPDSVMPPPEAKIGRLTDEQVDLLKRWIAQGAPYEPHWAFVPVAKPELAEAVAPSGEARPSHPIDRIVRSKLEQRGIKPLSTSRACPPRPPRLQSSSPTPRLMPMKNSWTGCWRARGMASGWRPTGWTSPAIPTATAFRSIASDRCGPGETG